MQLATRLGSNKTRRLSTYVHMYVLVLLGTGIRLVAYGNRR